MSGTLGPPTVRRGGRLAGYLLAVLATLLAALLRWALDPLLYDTSQYLLYYFSVMVAALVGGRGPALLALLLSGAAGTLYFVLKGHLGVAWVDDVARLVFFLSFGALATWLAGRLHEARDRAARTAESLRQTTEQARLLAAALEAAPNAISLSTIDHQGTIVWVNSAFTRLTGYSAEEVTGQTHHLLSSGQQHEAFYHDLWAAISRGEVWRGELVDRRKDGTPYHEEMGITPLRDEHGQVTHYVAVKQDITVRQRTEAALRESERKYRILADNTYDWEFWLAPDGRFLYCSPSCQRVTGYEAEAFTADPHLLGRIVHPEDRPIFEAHLGTGQVCASEEAQFRIIHRDGSIRWIDHVCHTLYGETGHFLGVRGSNRDITARKRAEELLRESEQKLRLFVEHAPAAIAMFDRQMRYLVVSRRWLEDYHLEGDVIGRSHYDVFPDMPQRWREVHQRGLAGAVVTSDEDRWEQADGSPLLLRWEVRPWFDAAGQVGGILIFSEDITQRKQAEEALRESQELFRIAAENAQAAFGIIQGQRFVYANAYMAELSGYSLQELMSMPFIQTVHPDYRQTMADRARRRMMGEAVPRHYEFPLLTKSGQTRWLDLSLGRIEHNGQPAIVGTAYDITDRKRIEEEFAAAKAAAEQANAAKDEFLAVLSHELRTPLTPVLPALEELARRAPEAAREDLEMALRNVELEARLIDDLLDVTRIARGKVELHRQTVEFCTVLRRAAEVCLPDVEARRLHFGIKVEGGPYPVDADPARLQQVFWNLIKNAIKFTPHGGCVGIHCRSDGDGHVVAEVKDSGMGIEPAALQRIFNAFEQTDRSVTRHFGGLGLGLAISKALVELHGGTIHAHSDGKGKGATFTVRLPIADRQLPTKKADGGVPNRQSEIGNRQLRILLVEDHGDTARVMRRLLRAKGHDVEAAADVATALELAQQKAFDLLISDLGLPDANGLDLMRQLVAQGKTIPAIALSGYGQDQDIAQSRDAGFAAHLTKPVNIDQLIGTISTVTR